MLLFLYYYTYEILIILNIRNTYTYEILIILYIRNTYTYEILIYPNYNIHPVNFPLQHR